MKTMWIVLIIIAVLFLGTSCFVTQPRFGRTPKGERMERVKNSPNYYEGKFQNLSPTPQLTSEKSRFSTMAGFLFKKKERLRPDVEIPCVKTDLLSLNINDDVLVWFGHSSYFIQISGRRILVDPVFSKAASPVSFFNKSFKGANCYDAEDIPDIDYLIITHDHWDHLDYSSVKKLKPRIRKVICGLGVGEHFERWKFDLSNIVEMDWNESFILEPDFELFCLPTRHFSGRGLKPNQSLWASFLVKTSDYTLYVGGDGGYDTHFAEIGNRFESIDLALLENGQYDINWRFIHTLPNETIIAAKDLNAKRMMPGHNSKYALGNHAWDEPMKRLSELHNENDFMMLTPKIGEVVNLRDNAYLFSEWWKMEQ